MLRIALVLSVAALALPLRGQSLRLVDAVGSPIPYVNAYAPAISAGTVSGPDGILELTPKMAAADASVPVRMSCVGYRDTLVSIGELRAPVHAELVLAAADYTLAEAEVSGEAIDLGKARRLGLHKPESDIHASFTADMFSTAFVSEGERLVAEVEPDSSAFPSIEASGDEDVGDAGATPVAGTEFGNVMRIKGRWRLDRVGANFSASETACTYELNVYAYDDGEPGRHLHAERYFLELEPSAEPTELTVDLADEPIYGTGDFLVVLEAVTPGLTAAPTLHARLALRRRKRITRFRQSDGTWRRAPIGVVVAVYADIRELR